MVIQNIIVSLELSQSLVVDVDQEIKILEETFMKNTQFFKGQFEKTESCFPTFTVNHNSVEEGLNSLCELDIEAKNIQHNKDEISKTKNEVNRKLKDVKEHVDNLKDKTLDLDKRSEESDKQLELLKMQIGGEEKVEERSRKKLLRELQKMKDVLGLELATSTRGGTIFTFTKIEKQDPSRKFICHLGLSNKKYKVIECAPALPYIDKLVQILNDTNDLSGFVQKIRQKFEQNLQ